MSKTSRDGFSILGLGIAACVACCAGPILAFLVGQCVQPGGSLFLGRFRRQLLGLGELAGKVGVRRQDRQPLLLRLREPGRDRRRLRGQGRQLELRVPRYVLESEGPDHDKRFTAEVHIGERVFPGGSGRSKKEAEQEVAEIAWRAIMTDTDA